MHVLTEDNFAALIRLFMSPANPKWTDGLGHGTKRNWQRELEFIARPKCLGAKKLGEIGPWHVQWFMDCISKKPGKQSVALAALKSLQRWARVRRLLTSSITEGVEITKPDDDAGHVPWTNEQIAVAVRVVRPDMARLITLGAWTGQRVSDLVRMCPTDIERVGGMDGINVRQKKTGREVWIPIFPELAAAIERWERRPGPFVIKPDGRPWASGHTASDAWRRERERREELREHREIPLHIHGLRGHACVRLSRDGYTDHEIGNLIGMHPQVVSRYTKLSVNKVNNVAAIFRIENARGTMGKKSGGNAS